MAKIFLPLQEKKDGLKCGSGPVPGQQYFPNQWKKFSWLRPTPRKGECELLNSRADSVECYGPAGGKVNKAQPQHSTQTLCMCWQEQT